MFDLATVWLQALPRFRRGCRRCADERGAAGIEFALIAPILIALVIAIIDLGMATYAKREAHAAAQAAAQFSLIAGWEPDAIESAAANSSALAAPLITVERVWACASAGALSFVAEGSSCSGGAAGTYVRVTVDPQFTPILPMDGLAVGPAVAVVRIE
jgi:Flp pilus assembly protein TadG